MSISPSEHVQLFIEDAIEQLAECDRAVLILDGLVEAGGPEVGSALNTLFRGVHTIKGNAGIMGYDAITEVAHVLEETLDKLRSNKLGLTTELADLVFAGLDALRGLTERVQSGEPLAADHAALIAGLQDALGRKPRAPAPATAPVERPAPPRLELQRAEEDFVSLLDEHEQVALLVDVAKGASLFNLTILPGEDLAGRSIDELKAALTPLGTIHGPWTASGAAPAEAPDQPVHLVVLTEAPASDVVLACGLPAERLRLSPLPWEQEAPEAEPVAAIEAPPPAPPPAPDLPGEQASGAPRPDGSVRVGLSLLDKLMNLVGELVLNRNQALQHFRDSEDPAVHAFTQGLNLITTELQEVTMRTRMQPVGTIWEKFPRLVRDYGRTTGKKVQLLMEGAETEVDKNLLEAIKDPLTHLVRNALDHGLEFPEERAAKGKPAMGTVLLVSYQDSGRIIVEIQDDGRGLNYDRIREKARAQGLVPPEKLPRMSESELAQLIFKPGFSTAEQVTSISGRGVGMDVVKSNIERIGGGIEILSRPGAGTTMRLSIPLTLAVIQALMVQGGSETFAIPQAGVLEVAELDDQGAIEAIRGRQVYRLRDMLIPVVALREVMGFPPAEADPLEPLNMVVLKAGMQIVGLIVDAIGDAEEIVVKPTHPFIQPIGLYAGVTISGEGRARMILDLAGLAARGGVDVSMIQEQDGGGAQGPGGQPQRMLICRIGPRRLFAVPMALVSRIEEFEEGAFSELGHRRIVQVGGGVLPVVSVEPWLDMPPAEAEDEIVPVLVVGEHERAIGVRVTAILDIIEDFLTVAPMTGVTGVLGVTVVDGAPVEVLDAHGLIDRAYPGWFQPHAQHQPLTLLLVEDSGFFRSMLREHLEAAGHTVYEASDGEEGLQRLAESPVDLVLSDIEMPQVDGLAFVQRLRAEPAWAELPCIALTSLSSPEARASALSAGFTDFMVKYDRYTVLKALAEAPQRFGLRRQP